MSRSKLVLYQLDRPALKALSADIEGLLVRNDHAAFAERLKLDAALLRGRARLVDYFLVPEHDSTKELHAALRRLAKRDALTPAFASDSLALEGRLRAFEPLRENAGTSAAIDRLLNPKRVPWYLRATGATAGWLDGKDRADLSQKMDRLMSQLTPELQAFARGLGEIDGDVIAHDSL